MSSSLSVESKRNRSESKPATGYGRGRSSSRGSDKDRRRRPSRTSSSGGNSAGERSSGSLRERRRRSDGQDGRRADTQSRPGKKALPMPGKLNLGPEEAPKIRFVDAPNRKQGRDGGASKENGWLGVSDMWDELGEERITALSTAFYTRVYDDTQNQWFRMMFVHSADRATAIENQKLWLFQRFGGPRTYNAHRPAEGMRAFSRIHRGFRITPAGAQRWITHWQRALHEVDLGERGGECRDLLAFWGGMVARSLINAMDPPPNSDDDDDDDDDELGSDDRDSGRDLAGHPTSGKAGSFGDIVATKRASRS